MFIFIQLAADMQRFSRSERRINGPTVTHIWFVVTCFALLKFSVSRFSRFQACYVCLCVLVYCQYDGTYISFCSTTFFQVAIFKIVYSLLYTHCILYRMWKSYYNIAVDVFNYESLRIVEIKNSHASLSLRFYW